MKTHLTTEEAKTVLEALQTGVKWAGNYPGALGPIHAAIRIMEAEDVKPDQAPIAITEESAPNGIRWYVPPPENLRNGMNLYFASSLIAAKEADSRAALSAPAAPSEQKPVAYRTTFNDFRHFSGATASGRDYVQFEKPVHDSRFFEGCDSLVITPLYASPQAPVAAVQEKTDPTNEPIQRACGELPLGYSVIIELVRDAGTVEWMDAEGERYLIDGEGYIA